MAPSADKRAIAQGRGAGSRGGAGPPATTSVNAGDAARLPRRELRPARAPTGEAEACGSPDLYTEPSSAAARLRSSSDMCSDSGCAAFNSNSSSSWISLICCALCVAPTLGIRLDDHMLLVRLILAVTEELAPTSSASSSSSAKLTIRRSVLSRPLLLEYPPVEDAEDRVRTSSSLLFVRRRAEDAEDGGPTSSSLPLVVRTHAEDAEDRATTSSSLPLIVRTHVEDAEDWATTLQE